VSEGWVTTKESSARAESSSWGWKGWVSYSSSSGELSSSGHQMTKAEGNKIRLIKQEGKKEVSSIWVYKFSQNEENQMT